MLTTGLTWAVHETMTRQTPPGYAAEHDELAGPAVFLASDHTGYTIGATLDVSTGLMYQRVASDTMRVGEPLQVVGRPIPEFGCVEARTHIEACGVAR